MVTPNPWRYGIRRDGSMWLSLGDPANGPHRQGGLCATKEDADLICAAPDLLEASENLLFRIRNIGYWNKPDTEMYIKALEAAVSRARGET